MKKKELENYLLVPQAIRRVIVEKIAAAKVPPSVGEIKKELEKIAADLLDDTIDSFATSIHAREKRLNPKFDLKTANQRARAVVGKRWNNLAERLGVIGGKKTLAQLAQWSQKNFAVSLGASSLASALTPEEIDDEIRAVLLALERNEMFVD
ncbi:MAG: hypothetical protein C5B58_12900 [Acidobacteria bacterium]|nr:MAG: hypothetical protein C5B58_12900 [Acidobacteriota bacterium]